MTTKRKKKPRRRQHAAVKLRGQTTPPLPATLHGSGFGRGEMNGTLTIVGTVNGKPNYRVDGYWNIWWRPDLAAWVSLEEVDERFPIADYYRRVDSPTPVGQWEIGDNLPTHPPAGIIA